MCPEISSFTASAGSVTLGLALLLLLVAGAVNEGAMRSNEELKLEGPAPSYTAGLDTPDWPCKCEWCSFIEKEYLVSTTWPLEHHLPHDCLCEYTIRGKKSEYVAKYKCDSSWYREHYCQLPVPIRPDYYGRSGEIGTPGKTRLGSWASVHGRSNGDVSDAMLRFKWIDNVFTCN